MRAWLFTLAVATGCVDHPSACEDALVGDADQAPALEVVTIRDGNEVALADGDDCPLILAPQGGEIVLAGVRARNVSAGPVELTGWLLDPGSRQVVGLESRPVELIDRGDGVASAANPDSLAAFANISACPTADLPRDVHDQPWVLAVRVEDCGGRFAEAQVVVTPRCEGDAAELCTCQCDMDYLLGDPCAPFTASMW